MVKLNISSIKTLVLFIAVFLLTQLYAQDDSTMPTLRFTCGLTQSFMNDHSGRPLFADGFMEYYPEPKISFRGSLTQLVADRTEQPILKNYTGFSLGAFYHFLKNKNDFSIGLQPGFALQKVQKPEWTEKMPLRVGSTLAITTNYTLFFHQNFHFYVSATENISHDRGTPEGTINTSWLGFTGGLGYHF